MNLGSPSPSRPPASGLARRIAFWLLPPALVLAALLLASRGQAGRVWLAGVTGEESWWEGVKGTAALAGLGLRAGGLELQPDGPLLHRESPPYGVNSFVQLEADPELVRRSFALMHEAGIAWARQQFPWEDIEIHARGDFQDRRNEPPRSAWDKYDRIVQEAQNHKVQLLVRLDDPPEWAYADPAAAGAQKGPPSDIADYANFVGVVAKRYCGRLRYYQLWNEPNIYPEWGGTDETPAPVDPAGYAALLKAAAAAARQACPGVVIVSAALAPTTEPGGRNMHDLRYLEALYQAGWQADFDILAVQGFGLWTGPSDRRVAENRTNFVRPLLARDIMVRAGDGAKPVWMTEFGWDSPPAAMEAPYGRVDEATRAAYTTAAYERMAREWPWMGTAFVWFFRRPNEEWHQRPEGYFRLVEPDWTPLPAFESLRELALATPLLEAGRRTVDHHALRYSGPWTAGPATVEGAPSRQGLTGAELDLAFRGDGLLLLLRAVEAAAGEAEEAMGDGPAAGSEQGGPSTDPTPSAEPAARQDGGSSPAAQLYLVLDGRADPRVEVDTVGADADGAQRLRLRGLPLGEHRLLLRVDGPGLLLEGLQVLGPEVPPLPRWPAVALVLVLALPILLLAVAVRRQRRVKPTVPGGSIPTAGEAPEAPAVEAPEVRAARDLARAPDAAAEAPSEPAEPA